MPRERVFVGVTYHSATLLEPGEVDHTAVGTHLPRPDHGGRDAGAERIRATLSGARLDAEVMEEIVELIWRKLVLNASANPIAALTGLRAGALAEVPEVFAVIEDLAREVVTVGRATGHDIDEESSLADVHDALIKAGPATSSMRQDVEAGRRTEIDVMNGAVLRAAEDSGVEVPLNRVIHALGQGLRGRSGSPMSTTLRFLGVAGFEIVSERHRILIDPFLTGNALAPCSPDEIDTPDVILVTHAAYDHYGDAAAIARRTGAPVVCGADVRLKLIDDGVAPEQIQATVWGVLVEVAGVVVRPVECHHWSFATLSDGRHDHGHAACFHRRDGAGRARVPLRRHVVLRDGLGRRALSPDGRAPRLHDAVRARRGRGRPRPHPHR